MELTELTALEAYAKMMNILSIAPLENMLADDFVYESQNVFQALDSKQLFISYMVPKLKTISQSDAAVFAEMGTVSAFNRKQPCVILAQNERNNLVGLVLAKVDGGKLKRLDLCVVPSPGAAERSGKYPK